MDDDSALAARIYPLALAGLLLEIALDDEATVVLLSARLVDVGLALESRELIVALRHIVERGYTLAAQRIYLLTVEPGRDQLSVLGDGQFHTMAHAFATAVGYLAEEQQ